MLFLNSFILSTEKKQGESDSWLFRISGNNLASPSYIYGTFHTGISVPLPVLDSCRNILSHIDLFLGELDLEKNNGGIDLMQLSQLPEGKKLYDLYTEEEFGKIQQFFKDTLQTDIYLFGQSHPMMAYTYGMVKYFTQHYSMSAEISSDLILYQLAREKGVEIKGFETIEQQADILFHGMPDTLQAHILLEMVSGDQWVKDNDRLLTAYHGVRMQEIADMIKNRAGAVYEQVFLNIRNENWLKEIKYQLDKKNRLFIAVGAGHLLGEEGLITQLQKKGYTITQIKY